jgi:non-ribosomal peptide synthetase component F
MVSETSAEDTGGLASRVKEEDLAYVMFTSGSTGRPIDVCIIQRG